MAKYVTILDIARELGISKSTVSRALSGDTSNVKAATIEKILETARRMGYHRNELAVNLRKQSTHNIGIIIPEIITSFYMNFVNHVQSILRTEGYKVIISVSNESPEQERENIQMLEQIRVDGILMSVCNKDKNQDLYNKVIERGIPIVFFDRTLERKQASQVRMDDNIMSFFMVEALIDQGRKHIVHIPGPSYIRNGYDRLVGYREALEKHLIKYDSNYVLTPALSADEGAKVMEDFLQRHITFDAVFGFTETALLGAKTTLQKHGFRIPEDVALCCMSGTALSTLVHPTITAVEQPVEEMAKEACRLLLAHLQDANQPTEDIVLRGETIFRESFPKKSM
nr:LacI family DNA-binding transcriptional regulator [uncultured Prevotella sp.]